MWALIVEGAFLVGDYVYRRLTDKKPKAPPTQTASLPRVDAGAPVPLLFGRARVRAPVMAWAGNWLPSPVFDSSLNQVASAYQLDMLYAVAVPMYGDTSAFIYQIWAGDQPLDPLLTVSLPPGGSTITGRLAATVSKPDLLGGSGAGGGIYGTCEFWDGRPTQQLSDGVDDGSYRSYVELAMTFSGSISATLLPGHRNMMLAFHYQWGIGESGDIQAYSYECSSWGNALTGQSDPRGTVNDANPANVIYDVLTSPFGKLNLAPALIDIPSFVAFGNTLVAEQHGYSRSWEAYTPADDIIADVLTQVDGAIRRNPYTGLVSLKLVRRDYDITLVPNINPSNAVVTAYSGGAWTDTYNHVRVIWTNPAKGYADDDAGDIDDPNATAQGFRVNTVEMPFRGVTNAVLAGKIAQRENAVLARPLVKCTVEVNRDFGVVLPGDVVSFTWPEYNVSLMPMRVGRANYGQIHSNKITLDLIQDVFDAPTSAVTTTTPPPVVRPLPMTRRLLTEAPRYLAWWNQFYGSSGAGPEVAHVLSLATPDDASSSYVERSAAGLALTYALDVALPREVWSGLLVTAYPKTLAPYDTTTGIVIGSIEGPTPGTTSWDTGGTTAMPGAIAYLGTGAGLAREAIGYESVTALGGGQFRLNNVHRAQADTVEADHAVGEFVFLANPFTTGVGGYLKNQAVRGKVIPRLGAITGSGEEAVGTLVVTNRCLRPMRVANLALGGKSVTGTTALPAVAGHYNAVTALDEGVDLYAARRDRFTVDLVRGDAADEFQNEAGIVYAVSATKVGGAAVALDTLANAAIDTGAAGKCYLLGGAGHGAIDVGVQTQRTVQPGEAIPLTPPGSVLTSIQTPTVRVQASRYRNLLGNASWSYNDLRCWTLITAATSWSIGNDASSVRRDATGFYLTTGTTKALTIKQTVDVTGYLARGMTARLVWYRRNLSGMLDTGSAQLDGLTAAGANTGTASFGSAAASITTWTRQTIQIAALGALTTQLVATFTAANTAAFAECKLFLGQMLYDLLANGSFETSASGSWTVSAGAFVQAATVAMPSANYAQGGAFATSAQFQDFTIPTGWEYGTVVLDYWRLTAIAGDFGAVSVFVFDAGGTVIASNAPGATTNATLNEWAPSKLTLSLPATGAAAKVRVTLTATRAASTGNSGACFDDFVLSLHKNLDPSHELILNFDTPTVQPMPSTWQEFHLAYPAILPVPTVFAAITAPPSEAVAATTSTGDSLMATTTFPIEMTWNDGLAHVAGKAVGMYGGGRSSANGYALIRASGPTAADLRASGLAAYGAQAFAAPHFADSWSVVASFQTDEIGPWAGACGVVGRMGVRGWEIAIDATGKLYAVLTGVGGSVTINLANVVTERARHQVTLVVNGTAKTATLYDETGNNVTVSTVAIGEIYNGLDPSVTFRIGRSRDTLDVFPGIIERVYWFPYALTGAVVPQLWTYGGDPTGGGLTVTRSVATWAAGIPDAAGATLHMAAAGQVGTGYHAQLASDGGTGLGLALARACTNLIPSYNFANSAWTLESGATITRSVQDATGRARGVTVVSPSSAAGLVVAGLPATTTSVTLVFHAASPGSSSASLSVQLLNSSGVVKQTIGVPLTGGPLHARYAITFTSWDSSTATASIRFASSSGSTTFLLTHVMAAVGGADVPTLIPAAGGALADVTATYADAAQTVQFSAEGELVVTGVDTTFAPSTAVIVNAAPSAGSKVDTRVVDIVASRVPRFDHYDGAGTNVSSNGTALDWTQLWTIRGRWARTMTLDNATNPYAGIVVAGSAASAVYGRTATWTPAGSTCSLISLGSGAPGTGAPNALIRQVVIRAREPKLV